MRVPMISLIFSAKFSDGVSSDERRLERRRRSRRRRRWRRVRISRSSPSVFFGKWTTQVGALNYDFKSNEFRLKRVNVTV